MKNIFVLSANHFEASISHPPFWATLRQMPKGLPEGLPMGRMMKL